MSAALWLASGMPYCVILVSRNPKELYQHLGEQFDVCHAAPFKENYCFVGIDDIRVPGVNHMLERRLERLNISRVRTLVCPMYRMNHVLEGLSTLPRRYEVNFKVSVFWVWV